MTGIWSALMTKSNQYIAFVMARLFGGFFGGIAPALGADTIVDMFFLHQRGKGLTILNLSFLGGVVVGPTLSGFIAGSTSWPVQFWWSNGLEAFIILLSLFSLDETYYNRTPNQKISRKERPKNFLAHIWATFFCGRSHVLPHTTMAEVVSHIEVVSGTTDSMRSYRPRLSLINSRLEFAPSLYLPVVLLSSTLASPPSSTLC